MGNPAANSWMWLYSHNCPQSSYKRHWLPMAAKSNPMLRSAVTHTSTIQQKWVAIFSNPFPVEVVAKTGIRAHIAFRLLMQSFACMYNWWLEKDYLTSTQVAQAHDYTR